MGDPIRLDEVLAELARLDEESPEGFTRQEMQDRLRLSERVASARLRAWVKVGVVEYAGVRWGESVDRKRVRIPVYRKRG